MGPTRPTEPRADGAKKDDFPSITRAERARDLQEELRAVASTDGWEPQSFRQDNPTHDSPGSESSATTFASLGTLTPGQIDRIGYLKHGRHRSAEVPPDLTVDVPESMWPKMKHVDRLVRSGSDHVVTEEVASRIGTTEGRVRSLDTTTPSGPLNIEMSIAGIRPTDGETNGTSGRHHMETAERRGLRQEISREVQGLATELYKRNPSLYSSMSVEDFTRTFAEYVKDKEELATIELGEIQDESAQVAQIERILGELGPDVGAQWVLDALTDQVDLPDMPQHQTFENFIAKVLENKKQAIEAAKIRAQRQREYMAEKYGEDPHIDRGIN